MNSPIHIHAPKALKGLAARLTISAAVALLWIASASTTFAEAALPNVKVVNSEWSSVTNFWSGTEPLDYPTKVVFEFSSTKPGYISGLICEYPKQDNLFESLKKRLQTKLAIKPRAETPGQFIFWRDEGGKRVVTLTLDETGEIIQLIVATFDLSIG